MTTMTTMTPEEKLQGLLADPFFVEVKARVDAGTLEFNFCPEDWWRPDAWTDPYGRVSIPFALRLALARPEITAIGIYYHIDTDFQHIRFDLNGETYIVRWYKTFILCRKSDGKEIDFGRREYDITESFSRGLHTKGSPHWRTSNGGPDPFLVLGPPDECGHRYTK